MIIPNTITVNPKCLFCDLIIEIKDDIDIQNNDIVNCNHCSENNTINDIINIAENEVKKLMIEKLEKQFKDYL